MFPRSPIAVLALTFACSMSFAQPCALRWDDAMERLRRANGVVALAVYDDGSATGLYAASGSAASTSTRVAGVARWNGVRWMPLGAGVRGPAITSLAVFDDGAGPALYVGGQGLTSEGVAASGLLRWNGGAWSAVADLGGAHIRAMDVYDPDGSGPSPAALYVGGSLGTIGGVASAVARWNGTSWTGYPSPGGTPLALKVADVGNGPEVFAGGRFYGNPNPAIQSIARWNGASWAPVGEGPFTGDGFVQTLAAFDDGSGPAIYAGGRLGSAGTVSLGSIGRWNGVAWSDVGGGVGGALPHGVQWFHVYSLCSFDDDGPGPRRPALFVGGDFIAAGAQQIPTQCIARWDGQTWSALGSGAAPIVLAMTGFDDGGVIGPALMVGGSFTQAGGLAPSQIARWSREPLPGDADHDRGVSFVDLTIVLRDFGRGAPAGPPIPGDLNMDLIVDSADLTLVLSNFGSAC